LNRITLFTTAYNFCTNCFQKLAFFYKSFFICYIAISY